MIRFAVLGSGSSGNSSVVCCGDTRILIDAGLSAKQLVVRLKEVGVDPQSLTAILLTHEHGDHVQGLEVFCRKHSIPVYGTVHTCHIVQQDRIKKASINWRKFEAGNHFEIGDLQIETFNVPHDAVDPVGFVFRNGQSSLGILSDVGHVTRSIVDRLKGVDSLFVESNYDDIMLQEDEKRPWSLKQRISNRHGHLSNKQTADLLKEVAESNLNQVVLGHLSSDCNTAEKALEFAQDALKEMGLTDVGVACAERKNPTYMYAAKKGVPAEVALAKAVEANLESMSPPTSEALIEAKAIAPVGSSIFSSNPETVNFLPDPPIKTKQKTPPVTSETELVQMELAL